MQNTAFTWQSHLGTLTDPGQFTGPLALGGHAPAGLIAALHSMTRIRLAEETIAAMVESGHVKCPVHLAIGQEAMAAGVAAHLRKTDRGFGNHRSHAHYLAMGGDVRALFAEVLGKATGCSKGFGGSMHLFAQSAGFYGSVPIVAGTIPLAVGAAIAAKFDGKGDIGIAFFGDGACEEGVFHESLNMAMSMQLPVLFLVENNLFSSHLDIHLRQPSDRIARFAEAACMDHATVDGNDITAVSAAAQTLIAGARNHNRPALLEGITYRWRGHVGVREDIDVGVRRAPGELAAWKARDPIGRLLAGLIADKHYTQADHDRFVSETKTQFEALRQSVLNDPWPEAATLLDIVYAQ